MSDYSADFYRKHADRYAEVAHQFIQSVYLDATHPQLKGDRDLHTRLKELTPGKRGLDAGCGAGARDVYLFWTEGYDMWGIDVIPENIKVAHELHPEIKERVSVRDLRQPLPFDDEDFDFVMCNAVIQHMDADDVYQNVFPEIARVLRPSGVFQLMFKSGAGIATVYDKDYESDRSFRLFTAEELLIKLKEHELHLINPEGDKLGGILYFTDPKPMKHGVFFVRKQA